MRFILLLTALWLCTACQSNSNKKQEKSSELINSDQDSSTTDYHVAERFLNEYVVLESDDVEQWIQQHSLLTNSFKASYLHIMEQARRTEPELGLGFDPILDAQDFPSTFTIVSVDSAAGYVTLKGVEWEDFLLVVKVVKQDDESLVDGAGIINVPEDIRR